jgi:hypothetical protein
MQLAFAVPWNGDALVQAREKADALLEEWAATDDADPWLLCGLAVLTGRATLAASAVRDARVGQLLGTPPPLLHTGPALLVFAALGGPEDSLATLERRVYSIIEEAMPQSERNAAKANWLAWAATLAYPEYQFATLPDLKGAGDYLLDMQVAWDAQDTAAVRRGFDEIRSIRRHTPPAYVTIDGLYPEASLLFAIGDAEASAAWLDPALHALPQVAPDVLTSPARAGSLVRAMALRARIAEQLGDRNISRQWARSVITLWSDADPFLRPILREMRRLAR